jgi:hypothetical protein
LVDTWITPELEPNKHIISCCSIIKPDNTVLGTFPNVLIKNGSTYTDVEIIDSNLNVLGSYTCLLNQQIPLNPQPEMMMIMPSIHIQSVSIDSEGKITIIGSFDVHFNFISFDLMHFTVTIDIALA